MNTYFRLSILVFMAGLVILITSCGPESTTMISNLKGYDVNHPAKIVKLPPLLDEISGIAYYPKDSSIFAVQDEEGFIYKIYPYKPDSMLRYRFEGHGDFEDIVIVDSFFYVLRSDGTVYKTVLGADNKSLKFDFPESGNEFESIFHDAANNRLRLVCKDCKEDGKKAVSSYLFDLDSAAFINDSLKFDAAQIAQLIGEKKIKFKPSAAAINPKDGKLYLVSAVNSVLVVANLDGSIYNFTELNKGLYKQPEGIAFAPDGTMFISNESADVGAANILIMPYRSTN